jgi:hypothetical protein
MDFKKYLPHLTAFGIFLALLIVFFKPIVFEKKSISQSDIENYVGMSKEIKDYRAAHPDDEPLWTNSMFGGMPAYQISVEYHSNWINKIQRGFVAVFGSPITIFLVNMVGFYFLLVVFGVRKELSIVGAIAFGFSSYMAIILGAGHNSKAYAMAYMAPVLIGLLITARGKLLLGGAVTAIALAFELNANHFQITYYLFLLSIFIVGYEFIRLIREKNFLYLGKAALVLVVAVLLAVLPNIGNIMGTQEYAVHSTRGKSELTIDNDGNNKTSGLPIDYATQWSYGVNETFTLIIPDYNGGASSPIYLYNEKALDQVNDQFKEEIGNQGAYFGSQGFTSGPVYAGALICFLFVLGMFIVKDSVKWWILGATVLSVFLAWGRNFPEFTEFVFHYLPGYNKFRAVSMTLVIASFTIPLLAILTVRQIINDPEGVKLKMKYFWVSLAITAGFCFFVAVSPTSFVDVISDSENARFAEGVKSGSYQQQDVDNYTEQLSAARSYIVSSDAWRSFFIIVLGASVLFAYIRKWIKFYPLVITLGIICTLDMFLVAERYLDNKSGSKNTSYEKRPKGGEIVFQPNPANEQILQDTDPDYRVLNVSTGNTWQESQTSYFHKSIGGYHGAKLKRIQELYEQGLQQEIGMVGANLNKRDESAPVLPDSMKQVLMAGQSRLNMLNTRYVIYRSGNSLEVLRNQSACGEAWFVPSFKLVANADSEIVSLKNFNPLQTAIIDKRFSSYVEGLKLETDSTASVKLVSYAPNKLRYESKSGKEQLAVFSEMYYSDGWNAYIDGKKTDHIRANYILRAMRIPAGSHTIEFRFEPEFYSRSETIALIGSIVLLLFLALAIFLEVRKNKTAKQIQ